MMEIRHIEDKAKVTEFLLNVGAASAMIDSKDEAGLNAGVQLIFQGHEPESLSAVYVAVNIHEEDHLLSISNGSEKEMRDSALAIVELIGGVLNSFPEQDEAQKTNA